MNNNETASISKVESITNRVIEIVKEVLSMQDGESIDINKELEDIDIDSLDTVEIIMSIEEEFNITISNDDANTFKTINDIVNYIVNLII
jgi:acyl carrier protein